MPRLNDMTPLGSGVTDLDEAQRMWSESNDDDATRIYLTVIRMRRPTRDLLLAQGVPAARLDAALRSLSRRGLLSVDPSGVIDVPSPMTAIPQHATHLERQASAARAAADSLSRVYHAARTQPMEPDEGMKVLADQAAVEAATIEILALAHERVRAIRGMTARTRELVTAPLASHREPSFGAGGRVVVMQTVWDATVLEVPGGVTALSARREGGEQQRSIALVPITVLVVDDGACLVEWSGDDDGPQGLLARSRGAVAAGAALFDWSWQLANPIRDDGEGADLDGRDATILRLMAAGVADAAIARQTGISQRTVERRVRHLMDRLDAQTRFQGGAQAVRRGWL